MKSSTFSLTNFTAIMVDIFFHSGTRKHKTTFHDWLIFLTSNINIATVAVTPTFKVFQGDLNGYTLSCHLCGQTFGEVTDLVSLLGAAASSIMTHLGFGLNWKELYSMGKRNIADLEKVFPDLGPILFTSAEELLHHIERNKLH